MLFPKKDIMIVIDELEIGTEYNGYKLIEVSEWVQDYKYQYKTIIFEKNGKYYSIVEGRSGSPFTDWNYDSEYWDEEVDCDRVKQVEITKKVWRKI